jgi:peptide/nickel transport system substrate-binding protein
VARPPNLKVFLAGRVAVESGGVVVDDTRFPGRQGRLVFGYLVAEQGRPVPRDELAEAVWGASPPATWEKALTVIVSKLRRLLGENGVDGARALTSAFGCYRLDLPAGAWIDVVVAAAAVDEAEAGLAAGDLDAAKDAATVAASLLQQPFLPGEDGGWVEEKRRELAGVRVRALSVLADACLRSGDAREAAKSAEQAIALEPFRETGYRRLMEAHVAAGDRAEALRVYEQCRRLLAEELGAYPSPETESIYRGLLAAPAGARVATAVESPRPPAADGVAGLRDEPQSRPARHLAGGRRAVAGLALTALAAAAAAGVLIEWDRDARPAFVVADSVGLIGADGYRVSSQVAVGQAPTSVATGAGAVWAANAAADTVSRIDPHARSVQQSIAVGANPSGIAVGGGGVWVANHDDNTVSWINPQSNGVVRTIQVGAGPTAIAYGLGSVWVANADDRTVTRIDAATGVVTRTIRTDAVGRGIAVGAGGVWLTDEATRSVVGIDPHTNTVTSRATVGSGPTGVAYADGSLWVANSLDDTVSRVDVSTLASRRTIPVPGGPSAVAFSDGVVWVSAQFGERVVRIDPRRGVVVGATPIGNRPEGLAPAGRGVWVAVQASGQGHRGGRLVVLSGVPGSVDPTQSGTGIGALATAYDGLTNLRHVGGSAGTQLVPDLAVALPLPTAGGRSYTFRLRPGIRYSDGRPLRAADFRRALARALELDSPWAAPFAHIAGATGCSRHRRCDLSRSVLVQGSTLTFRLPAPDPRLLWELVFLVPVPPGTPVHDVGSKPVPATGPYEIRSFVPGKLLTLVRNPYFSVWSAAARPDGYADEIDLRSTSEAAALRDFLHGRGDVTSQWNQSRGFQRFAASHPLQVHIVPQQATHLMFLNVTRPPFNDVRARRALSFAVDRNRVVARVGTAFARPTCQVVPPTVTGYRPYCPYTVAPDAKGDWKAPDLARARALIRESGTQGDTVVVWSFPEFEKESRYVVALLRQLGYRARLHSVASWEAYVAALQKTPGAQVGFISWFGAQLAVDALNVLGCHAQLNWARICDRRVDAEIGRLEKEEPGDPAGTADLAASIDRQITDEAAWVALYTPRIVDLTSARVGNYESSNGAVLLDQLWVR